VVLDAARTVVSDAGAAVVLSAAPLVVSGASPKHRRPVVTDANARVVSNARDSCHRMQKNVVTEAPTFANPLIYG
jgi:hypothetical protein